VFSRLRKTLDCHMRELTVQGIGVAVKRADPVSVGDEITFWGSGVLNTLTSKGLSYTVFFYNCKLSVHVELWNTGIGCF